MRRSERREAELRRENEIKASKAKELSATPRDVKNVNIQKTPPQPTERQIPRAAPRVTPRVIPREKDKPPEPALRRRNENNATWSSPEKGVKGSSPVKNSLSPEKLPSAQTTESSSNETIDINSSEEISDISSEEVEVGKEKESEEEARQEELENENEGDEEDAEDEEYEDEAEEQDSEAEEEISETEENEEEAGDDEENVETDENIEQEETGGEQEDETDEETNEDDGTVLEPPKRHHDPPATEHHKAGRGKTGNHTKTRKISRQHRDGEGCENDNAVNRQDKRQHHEEKRKEEIEISSERRGSHEQKTKRHQRQSSVSGSECGDVKRSRNRKDNGSLQLENASESPKEMKTKQHRRQGSGTGNDFQKVQEEKPRRSSDVSVEKTTKEEQRHASLARTKSMPKSTRRSSRNSLKSLTTEELEESGKTQTGNKTKQTPKKEETGNSTASGQNSRKASCADEETSEQTGNDSEVTTPTSPLDLYSNNVLGLGPANIQPSADAESEGTSSPDLNRHDEHPSKKAFVCAIHEEPCKYYCQDCERLICSECAMRWGDCHEHYYLRVKDAWKKYREEMMKILHEARSSVSCIQQDILENSKQRDSFKLKVESTIKKINSFFDEHVQALEKRRTNFLETVEEIMKFREIGINQEIESLQNNLVETNSTINIAGRVYGTSTMMEFLQVCKQLTNRLLDLGHKKIKLNITESIDIDFISEPSLFDEIDKLGQLKKHRDSSPSSFHLDVNNKELNGTDGRLPQKKDAVESNSGAKKGEENEQDSMDSVFGTSTENLSESTSAKDSNDVKRKLASKNEGQPALPGGYKSVPNNDAVAMKGVHDLKNRNEDPVKMKSNDGVKKELIFGQQARPGVIPEEPRSMKEISADHNLRSAVRSEKEVADCPCGLADDVEHRNGLPSDADKVADAEIPVKQQAHAEHQHGRRHSMDDLLGSFSKKQEIQRRLGNIGRYRPPKSVAQFLDEGERYFSSGEAEQRRRKQEYYKVRFNDRAYYSNPSDSSELEEMRGYDFEERPVKHKVRRHRTMPLIRPISERRDLKSSWTLDVFRYHGKIHFSRNSLKATGKAFGWNAVVGSQGFSQGKHTWKVRVTKWTAVGVCYKDDHVDNPSWGAGNKWTWDSADMCYSPRLGVCESPVGEWIDGDVIALELDCENSVLVVHNLRTSETDKLYGFKQPVYPYFYLSVFRSISLVEIDGIQVGS
ncbi:uncharacterized protein LOC114516470 [Dendronephthya gigantea]|uniref:uncharacterized protein LOC114516470 n=1 Tax=Dendronephthya gigantea TaxID=151771 RepID=UPI00106AF0FC|nr:uncharacterized protein LOC114516470 [Dendronephthya gigantea]